MLHAWIFFARFEYEFIAVNRSCRLMHFYALKRNLKPQKMRIICINKWNVQGKVFFSRELFLFFGLVLRRYKSVAFKFQSTRNYRFPSFSRDTFESFESTRLTFEFLIEKLSNPSLIQSYPIAESRLAIDSDMDVTNYGSRTICLHQQLFIAKETVVLQLSLA